MRINGLLVATLISALFCFPAHAGDLQVRESLEHGTRARLKKRVVPMYPERLRNTGREGWVRLSFVVSPDGTVADPIIEDSSGGREFERAARSAVQKWTYEPATWNGVPVEQCHMNVNISFFIPDSRGASRRFRARFDSITQLLDENEVDAARELLETTAGSKRLNLYELARVWLLRARVAEARGNTAGELRNLRRAAYDEQWLEPELYSAVLRSIFWLQIDTKKYSAALATHEKLAARPEEVTPEISEAVSQIVSFVNGDKLLGTEGFIADADETDETPHWAHSLLRREFGFAEINGSVGRLEIRCDWNRAIDVVEKNRTWAIPESWGNCRLFVFGEPGASFKLIEFPKSPAT
jgi:TonB family protein